MAGSDRWLRGGPLGIQESDDAGTQRYWLHGEPVLLLGTTGGATKRYYTGTTSVAASIDSVRYRIIHRTGTTACDAGVASTYSVYLGAGLRVTQFVAETLSEYIASLRVTQFVIETLSRNTPDPCAAPEEGEDLADVGQPLLFIRWIPEDEALPYGEIDLPDPDTYYGGNKQGRLLSVSTLRRALAGPSFDYEAGRFDVTIADPDRTVRALLGGGTSQYWTERHVGVYMVSDPGRRMQIAPRLIGYGVVEEAPTFNGLSVTLHLKDFVGSQLWGA